MATLLVSDESATGKPLDSWVIDDVPDRLSVREIIRLRVRDEVARRNLAGRSGSFNTLVTPTAAEVLLNHTTRRIDWERQADVAVRAFTANGFFMLVDNRQVSDLDELIDLRSASKISFVRLVQLVGG